MTPQPLTFNRRLLWSIELFWRNLPSQIGLALLAIVGTILIMLIGMVAMGPMQMAGPGWMQPPTDPFAISDALFSPMLLVGLLFVVLVAGVLMFWYQATLYQIAADSLITGKRAKLKTALRKSFGRLPDFMTTIGLVMMIVVLAELAIGLFTAAAAGTVIGIVVAIASLVLTVWLSLTFVMAGPIALLESHDPIGTLSRTWHLVDGMRWRMLGHFLLLALTMIVASTLAWVPLWLGAMVGGIVAAMLGFVTFVLWIILTFALIFVSLFFGMSFYFEARAVKGHWKAGWRAVPDPSWQISDLPDDVERPINSRGARAWLEFIALSLLLMVLLYGAALLLPPPSTRPMLGHPNQMMPQLNPGGTNPWGIEVQPAPEPATEPPSLTQADNGLQGAIQVTLTQDNFWADAENPSLWLKTSLRGALLPDEGINLGNLLRIEIDRITNRDGQDIYNRESPMEGPFFRSVNLQSDQGRLHGIRNVQLLQGSHMDDIVSIQGTLILTLPAEVERFVAGGADVGRRYEAQALTVDLKSISERTLALDVSGLDSRRRFLGVVAISTPGGDGVRQEPSSWGTSENGDKVHFNFEFDAPFEQTELYVANQILERQQSFALNHKSATIDLN